MPAVPFTHTTNNSTRFCPNFREFSLILTIKICFRIISQIQFNCKILLNIWIEILHTFFDQISHCLMFYSFIHPLTSNTCHEFWGYFNLSHGKFFSSHKACYGHNILSETIKLTVWDQHTHYRIRFIYAKLYHLIDCDQFHTRVHRED